MNRRRGGFTMIEVVVSILLTATLVSAVFSVALSTTQSTAKADRKMMAAQAQRALTSALKGYVTADRNNTAITGPNSCARCGACATVCVNSWNIHTPGVQTDSAGDVFALSPWPNAGSTTHQLACIAAPGADVGCFLPRILREPPVSGTISYTVTVGAANAPPQVTVVVNYNDL